MNRKELLHMLINHFFICYTCTMLMTVVFCHLNTPVTTAVPVSYLWKAALFSICADLPVLVYYSRKELSRKQWWIRTVIHTILVETVLLTAGHFLGMYGGVGGFILFFFVILAVDMIIRFVSYLNDMNTADEINARLQQERRGRNQDEKS